MQIPFFSHRSIKVPPELRQGVFVNMQQQGIFPHHLLTRVAEHLCGGAIAIENFSLFRAEDKDRIVQAVQGSSQQVPVGSQLLLRPLALGDIDKAFQKVFAPADDHGHHGLDNLAPLAGNSQENALGVVHRLTQIGNRATPSFRRTDELVALGAHHLIARRPNQLQSDTVDIHDPVRFRVDDDDPGLDRIDDGLEPCLALL